MSRFNLNQPFGARPAMPRWAVWLTMAASVVVGITLFLLAASLALILIPLVMIGGAVAAWRLRSRLKAAGFGQSGPFAQRPRAGPSVDVIDVEYRVIDQNEPPRR
jgi:hypothetical protein